MSKSLVAFFSQSGTTERVARRVADAAGANLFEIVAEQPYTAADVNWRDENSRSTREGKDDSLRPAVAGTVANMDQYSVIYLGFPVWWYREPNICDTFLEAYDLNGKTVVPFCTSGGSTVAGCHATIAAAAPGATVLAGATLNGASDAQIEALVAQA